MPQLALPDPRRGSRRRHLLAHPVVEKIAFVCLEDSRDSVGGSGHGDDLLVNKGVLVGTPILLVAARRDDFHRESTRDGTIATGRDISWPKTSCARSAGGAVREHVPCAGRCAGSRNLSLPPG